MYKKYTTNQTSLPIELSCLLSPNHIIFEIHEFIESMDNTLFSQLDSSEGRPGYHPRLLIKALLFAYSEGIYSGRKIEKMMTENIAMMWAVSNEVISYRTINRFRSSENCQKLLPELFTEFTVKLKTENLISMNELFIDGTKIEANANKYSFVWKKAIDRYATSLRMKTKQYFVDEIQPLVEESMVIDDLEDISIGELEDLTTLIEKEINQLTTDIEDHPVHGKNPKKQKRRRLKKHLRKLKNDFILRKRNYEAHDKVFNGRNSFSKIDLEATFMRMKDDHMMNGQLKAAYNIQIGTENQFVLAYDAFPNPTDTRTLIPFVESLDYLPKMIIADAGYGSEENLNFLNDIGVNHLIKYNLFDKEQTRSYSSSSRNRKNWTYHSEGNYFIHPDGTNYYFNYISHKKNSSGFHQDSHVYRPDNPEEAEQKAFYYNWHYEALKEIEATKLLSPEGSKIFARRKIEVEPVFGQVKANLGFTRFHLRGKEKIKVDIGLAFMANNFKKYRKTKAI
ncbi:cassette chromosome recombinase B1 [Carnobacterium sp. AT7]|uniref:Transposase n=2 Tax=Carnobacterium TaxID=2747 RepID=A0A1H0XI09_9LACT|nr:MULTISPECIES: IS1182 family transposase [Carnobacterium]EDP68532.1 cassette chromosome recombinase B1 [Carnobacterium sp. AT7]UDE96431.1 IS1182 family transposase [Carnobacterium viridans]SDQ02580.1 Transposase [Carnobacterium viridans]